MKEWHDVDAWIHGFPMKIYHHMKEKEGAPFLSPCAVAGAAASMRLTQYRRQTLLIPYFLNKGCDVLSQGTHTWPPMYTSS